MTLVPCYLENELLMVIPEALVVLVLEQIFVVQIFIVCLFVCDV